MLEAQTNFVDSGGNPITEVVVTSNGEMTENMIGSGGQNRIYGCRQPSLKTRNRNSEVASPPSPDTATATATATARSARGGGAGGSSSNSAS